MMRPMDSTAMKGGATADNGPDRGVLSFPYAYGLMHALVDTVTIMAVFSTILVHQVTPFWAFYLVVAYDLLAFAGQALLGHLVDRHRITRGAILAGILLSAAAVVLLTIEPYSAVAAAGIGNALFHVGAGALSLCVRPGRCAPPGIFVAPGALGLGLGMWIGKRALYHVWLFLGLLAIALVYAIFSKNPKLPLGEHSPTLKINAPYRIMGLLLLSIALRSLVGYAGGYACPKLAWIPAAFALAAFAGKGLGGIAADRWGWIRTSMVALLISAPLIAFFGRTPALLIPGLFFFQMTMPVTLVAIAAIIPARPGFAFGLACLVLVLGALPTFFPWVHAYYSPPAFLTLILLSAGVLFAGLRQLRGAVPMRF